MVICNTNSVDTSIILRVATYTYCVDQCFLYPGLKDGGTGRIVDGDIAVATVTTAMAAAAGSRG